MSGDELGLIIVLTRWDGLWPHSPAVSARERKDVVDYVI